MLFLLFPFKHKISYFTWPISKFCFFHCNQLHQRTKFSANRIGRLQIRCSGSSSRGGKRWLKKFSSVLSYLSQRWSLFLYWHACNFAYFHRPVFHWIWSLRNSTAMKVRAEAGMYHVILGTLPLNNPLTPSIIQILRIASSQPLYLQVHNSISKQYYRQNYICLPIWNTNIASGPS